MVTLSGKEVARDSVEEKIGFRWYEFRAHGPFFLNGERLLLRGTQRHEERAWYGGAVPDAIQVEDIAAIKAIGGGLVGRLWPRDDNERKAALDGGYDVVATGHNLDDEAAVLFGNFETSCTYPAIPAAGQPFSNIAYSSGIDALPGTGLDRTREGYVEIFNMADIVVPGAPNTTTLGGTIDPAELGPQSPHVRVEQYVDQAGVLPRRTV